MTALVSTIEGVEALTAAAAGLAPVKPPRDWFDNPRLRQATPLTVTDEGQVFGHIATWGSCHTGFANVCMAPPRSRAGYAYFHLGEVETAEGVCVDVGTLTLGTGHAPLRSSSRQTLAHYDNTGTAAADLRAGEDSYGIWVAGAIRPELSAEKVRELRAAKPSGDWRSMRGSLELMHILAVNMPGFPVPRPAARLVASGQEDERFALVAAGIPGTGMPRTRAEIRQLRLLLGEAEKIVRPLARQPERKKALTAASREN